MKQLSQNEAISIFAALLVLGFLFFGSYTNLFFTRTDTTAAPQDDSVVTVVDSKSQSANAAEALKSATDSSGKLVKLVVEDITEGTGAPVKNGDTITVHYTGTLQNGTRFDDSTLRGEPFTFTVGEGKVITGWDKGVVGMKVGGERVLAIPPSMGYGDRALGPIPPNSVLLFSIKLLEIQ